MTLQQFYKQYCSDIAERVEREKRSRYPYPYDITDIDEEGQTIYCVFTPEKKLLNVDDIIFMDDLTFTNMHPDTDSAKTRELYLSKLQIFDGADALNSLSIELSREKQKRDANIKEAERLLNDQRKVSEMFSFG